jgi:hypothetical protein
MGCVGNGTPNEFCNGRKICLAVAERVFVESATDPGAAQSIVKTQLGSYGQQSSNGQLVAELGRWYRIVIQLFHGLTN